MSLSVIILAAGKGTRMNSDIPKVLHNLGGGPLLWHAMRAAKDIGATKTVIVTGYGGEDVAQKAQEFDPEAVAVEQVDQLGTGHAVNQAREALSETDGDVIVLYGDTPFVSTKTLEDMMDARRAGADVVVLGFNAENPGGYGRLVIEADGKLSEIVEAKDASADQLAIQLCNSGVIATSTRHLFDLVSKIRNDNASGEYYLTDIVALARKGGLSAHAVICPEAETLGVNSRLDLAEAEGVFQQHTRHNMMENGVTLTAPDTVFFAFDSVIGRDVVIGPNVVFGPDVTVESGAVIRAFCHLEGCHISKGALIGPFARLRPGAEIADNAHVGNFVEIKNSIVSVGAKVNHLTYIGDTDIGPSANIGAGTITCNYDGVMKHRTKIGARAFIGSNTALVAPVSVGDDALTGSGSVITRDVPNGAIATSRVEQTSREGMALRHMERLRAQKAKMNKGEE